MFTQCKIFVLIFTIGIFSQITGCATDISEKNHKFNPHQEKSYVIRGHNYSFAVYNSEHRLISHPIEDLMTEMKWRKIAGKKPISDIYFISHGWNFTLPVAVANYHNYIERIDKLMAHVKQNTGKDKTLEDFQPYFIFVTWTSTVRPTTNLIKAVLPFGIDTAVEPITSAVDKIPLHMITTWKQSINASQNALGKHVPNYYLDKDWIKEPYGYLGSNLIVDDDATMGEDLPVSALIYELIRKKIQHFKESNSVSSESELDPYDPETDKYLNLTATKIHLVGHSYGAKLMALSGMEALRRWMLNGLTMTDNEKNKKKLLKELSISSETGHFAKPISHNKNEQIKLGSWYDNQEIFPIDSMILFNPAFTPGELSYPVDFPPILLAPTDTLRFIPRKAIVYSNTDYANGALFNLRDLALNGWFSQVYQTAVNQQYDMVNHIFDQTCKNPNLLTKLYPCNQFSQALTKSTVGIYSGFLSLAASSVYSAGIYAAKSIVNIPSDFLYHVENNTLDGFYKPISLQNDNGFKILGKGFMNTIDYFLPTLLSRPFSPNAHNWQDRLPLYFLRDETEQGLFRSNTPGLGKTGINHRTEGRIALLNLGGLANYHLDEEKFDDKEESPKNSGLGDSPQYPIAMNVKADHFCEYAKGIEKASIKIESEISEPKIQREYFYSFDASKIFDSSFNPFVGAHSDLRSEEQPSNDNCWHESPLQPGIRMEKRDYTMNFILRFSRPDLANALFNPIQANESVKNQSDRGTGQ
jgi:hypothetical protein